MLIIFERGSMKKACYAHEKGVIHFYSLGEYLIIAHHGHKVLYQNRMVLKKIGCSLPEIDKSEYDNQNT